MTMLSEPPGRVTAAMWWYVEVDGVSHKTIRAGPRDLASEVAKGILRIRLVNALREQGVTQRDAEPGEWGFA
jgi:hypothetical protein